MGINLGLCGAVATIVVQLTVGGAMALDRVKVGIINTIGDINVFIADEKGYFAKENISAEILSFDASARMMAPLGSGEIDIGGGSTSVGLFNAIDRGIGLRVVADKGRTAEGYVYQSLMIRKNLVESGKFRSLSDLKGLRIAVGAPGVGPLSILNEAAIRGGISYSDIDKVYLAFAQQIAGMKNGAVDGAIVNEPFKTILATEGIAVEFMPTQAIFPDYQVSMLQYGDKFVKERPDVAKRFMRAFLRAARDYNDALENGRWRTDGKADEVIAIFSKRANQPQELIRRITPQASDPDGKLAVGSIARDLAFFQELGDVANKSMTVQNVIDMSFAEAASKELGPYVKAR